MNKYIKEVPLVVDLDGTFIKTELPWESFLYVLKKYPLEFIKILLKKIGIRTDCYFKIELQKWTKLSLKNLPFSKSFLVYLKQQKAAGRVLILCTGSTQSYAEEIGKLTGLFDSVHGSILGFNLVGKNKAQFLLKKYGEKNFDYAGNSFADLKVAIYARRFILVNPSVMADLFSQKLTVYRRFMERHLDPIILIQTAALPLWVLNCMVFIFLSHSNFLILLFSVLFFNFLATSFSLFFKMINISTDRPIVAELYTYPLYHQPCTGGKPPQASLIKNVFSTGDLTCFAGFYCCILFFILALVCFAYLVFFNSFMILFFGLYVFGIYLWTYKKIGLWFVPKIIRYIWLISVVLLQAYSSFLISQ